MNSVDRLWYKENNKKSLNGLTVPIDYSKIFANWDMLNTFNIPIAQWF